MGEGRQSQCSGEFGYRVALKKAPDGNDIALFVNYLDIFRRNSYLLQNFFELSD
jgi:hypothetical protein